MSLCDSKKDQPAKRQSILMSFMYFQYTPPNMASRNAWTRIFLLVHIVPIVEASKQLNRAGQDFCTVDIEAQDEEGTGVVSSMAPQASSSCCCCCCRRPRRPCCRGRRRRGKERNSYALSHIIQSTAAGEWWDALRLFIFSGSNSGTVKI